MTDETTELYDFKDPSSTEVTLPHNWQDDWRGEVTLPPTEILENIVRNSIKRMDDIEVQQKKLLDEKHAIRLDIVAAAKHLGIILSSKLTSTGTFHSDKVGEFYMDGKVWTITGGPLMRDDFLSSRPVVEVGANEKK